MIEIPIEEYHKTSAISSTGLSYFDKAPAKYKAFKDGLFEDSDQLLIGRAFHVLSLEPDEFDKTFSVEPKADGRTKEGKQIKAEFKEANIGKEILSESQYSLVSRMAESVRKHSEASDLLTSGQIEKSFFWEQDIEYFLRGRTKCNFCLSENEHTGSEKEVCIHCGKEFKIKSILCKTRPDFFNDYVVVDLKTTGKDCRSFKRSVYDYNYHQQATFQLKGLESENSSPKEYFWIVVEKESPYLVKVYKAGDDLLNEGKAKFFKNLSKLKWCIDNNIYPGIEGVEVI